MNKIKKDNLNYDIYISKNKVKRVEEKVNLYNEIAYSNLDNFELIEDLEVNKYIKENFLLIAVKFNIKNEVSRIRIIEKETDKFYIFKD
jgi:hypothetical protein